MAFSLSFVFMNPQISGSINSIYPADIGDIEVQGSIQFAANYIQKLREFHIFVVHCSDLAVVDTEKNRSDPWVLLVYEQIEQLLSSSLRLEHIVNFLNIGWSTGNVDNVTQNWNCHFIMI